MRSDDIDAVGKRKLAVRRCADCGFALVAGPRGGAAQNFFCSERAECRQGFNLTFFDGTLVFAERIGEVDDDLFKLYAGDGR